MFSSFLYLTIINKESFQFYKSYILGAGLTHCFCTYDQNCLNDRMLWPKSLLASNFETFLRTDNLYRFFRWPLAMLMILPDFFSLTTLHAWLWIFHKWMLITQPYPGCENKIPPSAPYLFFFHLRENFFRGKLGSGGKAPGKIFRYSEIKNYILREISTVHSNDNEPNIVEMHDNSEEVEFLDVWIQLDCFHA